jgi:GxxExxY protein
VKTPTAQFVLSAASMSTLAIDELTELVIGLAMRVHDTLGPGLLESIYRDCFVLELVANDLDVAVEDHVPVFYREQKLRDDLKIDILVDGRLVVEVKAIERLLPVHKAQVLTYLKLTGHPAGLLLNFNATSIRGGLHRLDHPQIYADKLKLRARKAAAR